MKRDLLADRRSPIIAACLLVLACNGGTPIRGAVSSMPSPTAAERRIAGATITLECEGAPQVYLTSDELGLFGSDLAQPVEETCLIRVAAPGHHPRSYRVVDACAYERGTRCDGISLSARLLPLEPK